ncbi:type III-B CRISPR module-associated protein Cmr5 [Methanopyrus kandleri]
MDPGTFETVLRCVEEAERKVDLGTYHRRATRAAVMIAEEGLPPTLGFMSGRDDAGRRRACGVAGYVLQEVFDVDGADDPVVESLLELREASRPNGDWPRGRRSSSRQRRVG